MYPRKLDELRALASNNPKLDAALESQTLPDTIATRSADRLDGTRYAERRNNIAVINISDVLFTSGGLIDEIMAIYLGGTSTKALARDIQTAVDDASIDAIILNINSPGGEAFGINEVANLIYSVRGKKPIVSYVYGYGASAGYWLAAAAERVIVDSLALIGSIGVVAAWADFTGYYEQMGIAYEEVTSSNAPYKRLDIRKDDERKVFQAEIDGMEKVFINSVAKFRNVDRETVINEFGKGAVMAGQAAVKTGMVDSVGNLEEVLRLLSSKRTNSLNARPGIEGELDMGFKEEFKSFALEVGLLRFRKRRSRAKKKQRLRK
jgi:signal peptide peptidase SppA